MLRTLITTTALALFAALTIGCSLIGANASRPSVTIASPPSGSLYTVGETVVVQATATDPAGIVRVELVVDGVTIQSSPSPVATGQPQFSLLLNWVANTAGQHNIIVRATNAQGTVSDTGINLTVQAGTGATATATVPAPTNDPISTAVPFPTSTPNVVVVTATTAPTGVTTCTDNAAFGGDVSVPDGTTFAANAPFTKTWRMVNVGTCAWENYALVFVSGAQMSAPILVPVPNTAVGGNADVGVPMTAPASAGAFQGAWRLRNVGGALFGATVTVSINVAGPTAAVTNTVAPTAAATATSGACSGQPNPFTFTASAGTISAGQSLTLNWSAVNNASAVVLNGGSFSNQGVGAPGNITDNPTTTTTYTLTATCSNGGGTRTATAKVTVTGNAPTPTKTTQAATCGNPTIGSFTASPENIGVGQSTTISWSGVTGADKVTLKAGDGNAQNVGTAGSKQFTLPETTTFRLAAVCNAFAQAVAKEVTVTVNGGGGACNGKPVISSFTANKTTITLGQSITLSWGAVTNADSIVLDLVEPIGGGSVVAPGTITIEPHTSNTYTLFAACSLTGDTTTKSLNITVNP